MRADTASASQVCASEEELAMKGEVRRKLRTLILLTHIPFISSPLMPFEDSRGEELAIEGEAPPSTGGACCWLLAATDRWLFVVRLSCRRRLWSHGSRSPSTRTPRQRVPVRAA